MNWQKIIFMRSFVLYEFQTRRISYIKVFMHWQWKNVLFFRPMPFLSFLSQRYHYILVERNIELDISNRIGDASATAAASIHPLGDFLRSRKQNNSFYLRTLSDHFIGNGMVIQINKKTLRRWMMQTQLIYSHPLSII